MAEIRTVSYAASACSIRSLKCQLVSKKRPIKRKEKKRKKGGPFRLGFPSSLQVFPLQVAS
jgi:hypothetical protein